MKVSSSRSSRVMRKPCILVAKEDSGKHLKIAGATTVIREIMQVTGISQFIDIYDTVDEAVASFKIPPRCVTHLSSE